MSILKSVIKLTLHYICKQPGFKNEKWLQHITFGNVLNFCNIYVATKGFSEQECLWSSRYASTYFLHWIRDEVSIVLQKGLCHKRRVWILVNTLYTTGQCLLLKDVDIVLNLNLCFTFQYKICPMEHTLKA